MLDVSVEIDISDLERCLSAIDGELGAGCRAAVQAAVVEAPAEALTVRRWKNRTGELERRTRGIITALTQTGAEGLVESDTHYASYLDQGTKDHDVLPLDYHWGSKRLRHPTSRVTSKRAKGVTYGAGRGKFLRFVVGGQVVFARKVHVRGIKGDGYMRAAQAKAGDVMLREIDVGIARAQAVADG